MRKDRRSYWPGYLLRIRPWPCVYPRLDAGNASQPMLAPRLKMADMAGRSLMIHIGGDNHADLPAPLGGGGARVACGVTP